MKHQLLIVAIGMLVSVMPARGQYIYIDVNNDGLNFDREMMVGNLSVVGDFLNAKVEAVDVYLVTNQRADGSAATCTSGEPFTIGSYELILRFAGTGSVTVNGWTDSMGFDLPNIDAGDGTVAFAGPDIWIGKAGDSPQPAGSYKLGTLHVTITGSPVIAFALSSGINTAAETAFTSECDGARADGVIRLGPVGFPDDDPEYDFGESFGTTMFDAVVNTTWGKIKERYR